MCARPNSIGRSRLTSRLNRPTFNRISGASRVAWSCVGYALYTTHERPFFFNQSTSTSKNFFRFEVNCIQPFSHFNVDKTADDAARLRSLRPATVARHAIRGPHYRGLQVRQIADKIPRHLIPKMTASRVLPALFIYHNLLPDR